MMVRARSVTPLIPVLVTVVATMAACGADGNTATDLDLPPAGRVGRDIAITNGCGTCHGQNGEGGVGPPFVGLLGRTVQLDASDPIVADEAYIIESIVDPSAKRVDGYTLPMPEVNLSDDDIASIVAYITDLSSPPGTAATTGAAAP